MEIIIGKIKGSYFYDSEQKIPGIYSANYINYKGELFDPKVSVSFGSYQPVLGDFVLVTSKEECVSRGDLTNEEYSKEYMRLSKLCSDRIIKVDDDSDSAEHIQNIYNRDIFFIKYRNAKVEYKTVTTEEPIPLTYAYYGDPIDVPFTTPMRLVNNNIETGHLYQLKFSAKDLVSAMLKRYEENTGVNVQSHYKYSDIEFDKFKDEYINYCKYIDNLPKNRPYEMFTVSAIGTEEEVTELYTKKFSVLYDAFSTHMRLKFENNSFSQKDAFDSLCTIQNYLSDLQIKVVSRDDMRRLKSYIEKTKHKLTNNSQEE